MNFPCQHTDFVRRELVGSILAAICGIAQLYIFGSTETTFLVVLVCWVGLGFVLSRYVCALSVSELFELAVVVAIAFVGFSLRAYSVLPGSELSRKLSTRMAEEANGSRNCSVFALRQQRCGVRLTAHGWVVSDTHLDSRREHHVLIRAEIFGEPAVLQLQMPYFPWNDRTLKAGELVHFEAQVLPTHYVLNNPNFFHEHDRARSSLRLGVAAYGIAISSQVGGAQMSRLENFVAALYRHHEAHDALALIFASLLGEDQLLSKSLRDAFRITGTSHLIVVSGFHVGLAFFFGSFVSQRLLSGAFVRSRVLTNSQFGTMLGLVVVLGVSVLLRFSMPVLRAYLFILVFAYCKWTDRSYVGLEFLFALVLVANLIWPGACLDPSFQLTCAAVIGLERGSGLCKNVSMFSPHTRTLELLRRHCLLLREPEWLRRFLIYPLIRSGAVFLTTAPIVFYWFGSFRPLSVIWNLVIGGVFTVLVLVGGGIGVGLSALNLTLGGWFLTPILWAITNLIAGVTFLSDLSFSTGLVLEQDSAAIVPITLLLLFIATLFIVWSGTLLVPPDRVSSFLNEDELT